MTLYKGVSLGTNPLIARNVMEIFAQALVYAVIIFTETKIMSSIS